MLLDTVDKTSVGVKSFSIDWKGWLQSSVLGTSLEITESEWTVFPSGELEVVGTPVITGTITTASVSGGVSGRSYELRNQVHSALGEITMRHLLVRII